MVFNFWDTSSRIWNEIGDVLTLTTVNKVYTTGARSYRPVNRFLVNGGRFINTSSLSPEDPKQLKPGEPVKVKLLVAENVQEAKRRGTRPEFRLLCRFSKQMSIQSTTVQLNGKLMTEGSKSSCAWMGDLNPLADIVPPNTSSEASLWMEYVVDPDILKKGVNIISVEFKPETESELALEDIVLLARHYRSNGRGDWK